MAELNHQLAASSQSGELAAPANESKLSAQQQLRQRLASKLKEENDNYYNLYMTHQKMNPKIYDFYLDMPPKLVKRFFACLFPLNRLTRLILVHLLIYHTIWWLPNSASNNLAINYSNINAYLFYILVYINFYDLIVNQLFIRLVCFNSIKSFRLLTMQRAKTVLNLVEVLIHLLVGLHGLYYLIWVLESSIGLISLLFVPHICLMVYQQFDVNVMLFSKLVYSNQSSSPNPNDLHMLETMASTMGGIDNVSYKFNSNSTTNGHANNNSNNNNSNSSSNSTKLKASTTTNNPMYRDCSNISINSYLNQNFSFPTILSSKNKLCLSKSSTTNSSKKPLLASQTSAFANYSNSTQANETVKIIKQSISKTKSIKSKSNMLNRFPLKQLARLLSRIYHFFEAIDFRWLDSINKSLKSFHKTTYVTFRRRNSFSAAKPELSIEHKCLRDSFGIREETENFKHEFKMRVKEITLKTFESIYFNFVVTRLFVSTSINIRERDYLLFVLIAIMNTFISYWLHYMPLSVIVAFERNAQHLGKWSTRADVDATFDLNGNRWLNTKIYFKGERVFYMGRMYEVVSDYCASIPGNRLQAMFYALFSRPLRILSILLLLKLAYLLLLIYLVTTNGRWYVVLISIVETVLNSPLLFIILRDFLILFSSHMNFSSSDSSSNTSRKLSAKID